MYRRRNTPVRLQAGSKVTGKPHYAFTLLMLLTQMNAEPRPLNGPGGETSRETAAINKRGKTPVYLCLDKLMRRSTTDTTRVTPSASASSSGPSAAG